MGFVGAHSVKYFQHVLIAFIRWKKMIEFLYVSNDKWRY